MSSFTVARAPTLVRLFPEARLIHAVRDGRDAGASKVAKRQKREHPRDARQGVDWWLGRLAEAEAGAREVPGERLLTISLDELVADDREASYSRLLEFLDLADEPAMRAFFDSEMTPENAHRGRWREGLGEAEAEEVVAAYESALDEAEAEGFLSAPLLRRVYERERVAS
jgi:sulfotransferase family protein